MKKFLSKLPVMIVFLVLSVACLGVYIGLIARPVSYNMAYTLNITVTEENQETYGEPVGTKISISFKITDDTRMQTIIQTGEQETEDIEVRIIRNGNKILIIPNTMTDEEYNQMVEEAKADEEQWNAIWDDNTDDPFITMLKINVNAFRVQSNIYPDDLVCNGAIVFAVVFGVFELALIVFAVLSVIFYIKGKKGQSQTQQESVQDVEIGA